MSSGGKSAPPSILPTMVALLHQLGMVETGSRQLPMWQMHYTQRPNTQLAFCYDGLTEQASAVHRQLFKQDRARQMA